MATDPNPVPFSPLHQKTIEKGSTISVSQSTPRKSQVQITPRALSPGFTNILPSNQAAVSGITATGNPVRIADSSTTSLEKTAAIDAGPGPLRLPKPLTAVDLYAQLEKEQEAVVNRLTRELSLLRAAQNTSVVSSVSSTSASGFQDNGEYNFSSFLSGNSHPTSSYISRNRSSSTVSSHSMTAINPTSFMSCMAADRAVGRSGITRRESNPGINHVNIGGNSTSRRNSTSKFNLQGHYQSGASSPIAVPMNPSNYNHYHSSEQWPSINSSYSSRSALQRDYTSRSQCMTGSVGEKEVHLHNRFEDVAMHRLELENAKKENEILRLRVRELETLLIQKKQAAEVVPAKPLEN
ncbi:hypothetical protein EV44_g6297 [Erysiphe necator]|uniref:Uncharacterized protein n=1 Tax=Uncinula necator TaxID=52586 RepID=A0A0B1PB97_UNCNE|nr:hypothetical protein EV44_g6297 [Erysiphe necator]